MKPFIRRYGDHLDTSADKALSPNFTSLTTSSICIGDALGELLSAPVNNKFGRKITCYRMFLLSPRAPVSRLLSLATESLVC
jgi:hypothetical protein